MTSNALQYLRALIKEDMGTAEQLQETMDGRSWDEAGGPELDAAFQLWARRRFEGKALSEIVSWVAALRSELGEDANDVDPRAAEALIRAAVREERQGLSQLDPEVTAQLETVMAAKLGMEENLTDEELDAFLTEARELAAKWKP